MPGGSNELPSLEWVRVYEAAARLGSFTAAGDELGLTQAAVSQRIRNLELRVGAKLFDRQRRGVTLSTQGEAWLPHVQAAITQLAQSTANLFAAPRRKITIAASSSVIELWIVPRLPRVAVTLPHLQLSFETIQRLPDYVGTEADLEVRFGDGPGPSSKGSKLFDEELSPMVSPRILTSQDADWHNLPRIAVSGPRLGWQDWATARGEQPAPAPMLRFDTFSQALLAAEAGAGVLLGSLPLCQAALANGRLVRLEQASLRMTQGYWVAPSRDGVRAPELTRLIDVLTS